jgi:hypothetical protein
VATTNPANVDGKAVSWRNKSFINFHSGPVLGLVRHLFRKELLRLLRVSARAEKGGHFPRRAGLL